MTWYTPWWAETGSPFAVGCRCLDEDAETRKAWTMSSDGATYVHQCGQPSLATLRSQDMLNIFRFGPHHNELVETEPLCTKMEFAWAADYKWTPEKLVGSVSGREARVWVHKDSVT